MIKRIIIISIFFLLLISVQPAQALEITDEIRDIRIAVEEMSATLKGLRKDFNALNLEEKLAHLEDITSTFSGALETAEELEVIVDNIEIIFWIGIILIILIVVLIICPLIYMARKIGQIAKRKRI